MKTNQRGFGIVETFLICIAVIVIGGIGWYIWNTKHTTGSQQHITEGSRVTYTGKIEVMDLSAMPRDGNGVFVIKNANQQITVHLSSGESSCDRTALDIPSLKVGDEIKVSGDKGSDGIIRVCESGTYIKLPTSDR